MEVAYFEANVIYREGGTLPDAPPSILARPELVDPFSGAPIRWVRCRDKICVSSVGPNGRVDYDGKGGNTGDDLVWELDRVAPVAP
jgi:hypothetical protein